MLLEKLPPVREEWVAASFFLLNRYKIKANIIRHKNYFPIFVGYYSII